MKICIEVYISVPLFLHLWFGENHVLKYVPISMLAEIWNNINLYFGSNSNVIIESLNLMAQEEDLCVWLANWNDV